MKILLAQPSWAELYGRYRCLARAKTLQPPLGIAYLASIAERAKCEVKIIDAEADNLTQDSLIEAIVRFNPDVLGITSTTPTFHRATRIATEIKRVNDRIITLIGGVHLTALRGEAFEKCFDFGIYGEGEETFEELLRALGNRQSHKGISGLLYREGAAVIANKARERIRDLDTIPFPAHHLLGRYWTRLGKGGPLQYSTVILSRGCPFECVFCGAHTSWGHSVAFRSVRNVVDELGYLAKRNISHFLFVDSTLTLNRALVNTMCHEIRRRNLKITWEGWTRPNLIDRELMNEMKHAGLVRLSFGLESGVPRILKLIKKDVPLESYRRAYATAKELGIETSCSALIGLPGEKKEDIEATVKFIRAMKGIDDVHVSMAVPYPGTELYTMAKNKLHGLALTEETYSKFTPYEGGVLSVGELTPKKLRRLQFRAILKIHNTPKRFFHLLKRFGIKSIGSTLLISIFKINIFVKGTSNVHKYPWEAATKKI